MISPRSPLPTSEMTPEIDLPDNDELASARIQAARFIADAIETFSHGQNPPRLQSDSGELELSLDEFQTALEERHAAGSERSARRCIKARRSVLDLFERLQNRIAELERFETYVCQVIAMGNQADLTVESLPR